jgi:hypothetical protein
VPRHNRVCVSFYGWPRADRFLTAWRAAGFRPIAHPVFVKRYTSATRFVRYQHDQAYGRPAGRHEQRNPTQFARLQQPVSPARSSSYGRW